MQAITHFFRQQGLFISWGVALIATLGSLYFSQIMRFEPCALCWFQRIFMYPLIIMLAIATVKHDLRISVYIWPTTLVGFGISVYHYLLQHNWIGEAPMMCGQVPCTTIYINWLGFITIPFLAGTAFLMITIIHFVIWRSER